MRLETRAQFTREMMMMATREVIVRDMVKKLTQHLIENSNVELTVSPMDEEWRNDIVEWKLIMNINQP